MKVQTAYIRKVDKGFVVLEHLKDSKEPDKELTFNKKKLIKYIERTF